MHRFSLFQKLRVYGDADIFTSFFPGGLLQQGDDHLLCGAGRYGALDRDDVVAVLYSQYFADILGRPCAICVKSVPPHDDEYVPTQRKVISLSAMSL